jgi:glycosyltransferase involved in cell wall biosynthesis
MPTLSIVIPAYNEEAFIATLLEQVVKVPTEKLGFSKEILVVNDGSKDGTEAAAKKFAESHPEVKVLTQVPNQGKGKAVRRGIRESTGDYVLIQDADLEYDPQDYLALLGALGTGGKVSVYGSRTMGQARLQKGFTLFWGRHAEQEFGPWLAGQLLTIWALLLYGTRITDTLTAYKLYPAKAVQAMDIKTSGFETDHEITAKLLRGGVRIVEVPIAYHPRSVEEGKKIKPIDGLIAVWTLLKYRFAS